VLPVYREIVEQGVPVAGKHSLVWSLLGFELYLISAIFGEHGYSVLSSFPNALPEREGITGQYRCPLIAGEYYE